MLSCCSIFMFNCNITVIILIKMNPMSINNYCINCIDSGNIDFFNQILIIPCTPSFQSLCIFFYSHIKFNWMHCRSIVCNFYSIHMNNFCSFIFSLVVICKIVSCYNLCFYNFWLSCYQCFINCGEIYWCFVFFIIPSKKLLVCS